jgi:hypothetical protein
MRFVKKLGCSLNASKTHSLSNVFTGGQKKGGPRKGRPTIKQVPNYPVTKLPD